MIVGSVAIVNKMVSVKIYTAYWSTRRFILKRLDYSLSISMRDRWRTKDVVVEGVFDKRPISYLEHWESHCVF